MLIVFLIFYLAFIFFSCEIETRAGRFEVTGLLDGVHELITTGRWPKYWISYKTRIRREKPARKSDPAVEPDSTKLQEALVERELQRQEAFSKLVEKHGLIVAKRMRRQYAEAQNEDPKPTNL